MKLNWSEKRALRNTIKLLDRYVEYTQIGFFNGDKDFESFCIKQCAGAKTVIKRLDTLLYDGYIRDNIKIKKDKLK